MSDHDDRCETARFNYRSCFCEERAYAAKPKVDKGTVSMVKDDRNESVVDTLEEALNDARDCQAIEAFVVLRLPDGAMLTLHSGSDDTIMSVGYLRCLEHDILEGRYG